MIYIQLWARTKPDSTLLQEHVFLDIRTDVMEVDIADVVSMYAQCPLFIRIKQDQPAEDGEDEYDQIRILNEIIIDMDK